MKAVTFDDIENFDDTVRAEMEAFGGTVVLVSLGADLYAEYLDERGKPESEGMRNTLLLIYTMLSSEERDISKEQRITLVYKRAKAIRKKNLDTLATLTTKALEINGLGKKEVAERKNGSSEVPSGASPTESR